jgi:hypothetical protein
MRGSLYKGPLVRDAAYESCHHRTMGNDQGAVCLSLLTSQGGVPTDCSDCWLLPSTNDWCSLPSSVLFSSVGMACRLDRVKECYDWFQLMA